jgi:hypothetical protein
VHIESTIKPHLKTSQHPGRTSNNAQFHDQSQKANSSEQALKPNLGIEKLDF